MKRYTMNYTWTQPYRSVSVSQEPRATVAQTMALLERVDSWVDCMHSYPDVEPLIRKIKNEQF
jgi:hypothetical protein